MSYAQINYSQRLGRGPFTIAEAGCYLVAFCHLLERFGKTINPVELNNYFNEHGNYVDVDGDGTLDDLAWGTIAAYDGRITTHVGGAGWPDTNNAIVKFKYKSKRTGRTTTHFSLVVDAANGVILDSWDGVVKKSPYGNPVAWAKYEYHVPQVVTPPPPAADPAFTIENIPQVTKELKIDTKLWDLNQRSWPGLVNNPVALGNIGTRFETNQIARHIMGGSYYLPIGSGSQGYNAVDCQDPQPAPAPTPPAPVPEPAVVPPPEPVLPTEPKVYTTNTVNGITYEKFEGNPHVMYVIQPGGCEIWSFANVNTWRDFKSVRHLRYGDQVFIVGKAKHPIPPVGATYLMQDADFGNFQATGDVVSMVGINKVDLSETKPPALPEASPEPIVVVPPVVPEPTPPPVHVETAPVNNTAPVNWQDTYQPFAKPVHYVAVKNLIVRDVSGKQPDMPLPKFNPDTFPEVGKVSAYGTFVKDGVAYYRLRTNGDPTFSLWYAIPKIDPDTKTPLLLAVPTTPIEPVSKVSVARDAVELGRAHIENLPNLIDDMMPNWLKPKNKNKE